MKGFFMENALLEALYHRYKAHEVQATGAHLSYFLLLWIFPFIMFMMAVIGYLPLPEDNILYILSVVVPNEVVVIIGRYVEYLLLERKGHLLFTATAVALWTASNSLNALTQALNKAYQIKETRSYIRRKLMAVPMMLLLTGSIATAMVIPVLGRGFLVWLSRFIRISGIMINYLVYLRWLIAIFTVFNIILTIYYVVPNRRLKLRELATGAAFATVGWLLISVGFSFYVRTVSGYAVTYGSIGAVIILMIWLFLSAVMIIMGGELNAVLMEQKASRDYKPARQTVDKTDYKL